VLLRDCKRAGFAALFGVAMCVAFWLRPDGIVGDLSGPALMLGLVASGNVHQPSEVVFFLAMWAQWSAVAYGASIVFFPRRTTGTPKSPRS